MTTLSTKYLQAIVDEYSHLLDTSYSSEFCWEADVGNLVSPLGFAECCATDDATPNFFLCDLETSVEIAVQHLANLLQQTNAQRDSDNQIERDLSNLPDDILRNIALDARQEIEARKELLKWK
jgi:hypothetical protein